MGNGRITDPTDRESFKTYIRSKLGEPVIQLNVSEFQVDQAVDEALQYYRDYHYNGSTHAYYMHKLSQTDIDNRYFDVPDDLFGVTCVYDNTSGSGMGLNANIYSGAWAVNYDLIFSQGNITGTFLSFYMNKMYYDMVNSILVGQKPIRFNMHQNRVYLDSAWENYKIDDTIVLDGFQVLDPDANPEVWSDRWLIRYATAKLKRQWGENVSKYTVTLPGGLQINGDRIRTEADAELQNIEENMLRDYSIPPRDFIA